MARRSWKTEWPAAKNTTQLVDIPCSSVVAPTGTRLRPAMLAHPDMPRGGNSVRYLFHNLLPIVGNIFTTKKYPILQRI